MALNPKTKQLKQLLRAASMERNDTAAFALLAKIVEIDPGDSEVVEQKKAVGRRLFDTEVVELAQLIDAGDNVQLLVAMERLESYVDHAYAMRAPMYAEAMEIVKVCRHEQVEGKVRDMLEELARLKNLAEKDRKAVQIESLATNSGLTLRAEYKKILNKVHQERQTEIDRNNQLEQLEELNKSAYDLGGRLKILKQKFDKGVCEEILATAGKCASKCNGLNLLEDEEKDETRRIFESIQRSTCAVRKKHVSYLRSRAVVVSFLALTIIAAVSLSVYTFSTVGKRVSKVNERLSALDIPYIQEEVRSPMGYLYRLISNDYASVQKRCRQFLKEWTEITTQYRETKDKLLSLKSALTPQNISEFITGVSRLKEIHEKYKKTYKADLDTRCGMLIDDLRDNAVSYYGERRRYFMEVSYKEPVELIIKKYNEYLNEFTGLASELTEGIPACYWNALCRKYKDYTQKDEKGLDIILAELAQAQDAGIPVDKDFLQNVQRYRSGLDDERKQSDALQKIRSSVKVCKNLDEFVSTIKEGSEAYAKLPNVYPLSVLEDLSDDSDRMKLLAQYKVVHNISPDDNSVDLKKLSELEKIFCRERGNVYMGALSSSMYRQIKELASQDEETNRIWPSGVILCEQRGRIYIGKYGKIGDRPVVKNLGKTKFAIDVQNGKHLDLSGIRSKVNIHLKDLEDGKVLPVKILQSILKLKKSEAPATVRLYLYNGVVQLLEHYKNTAASGISLSPTLQKDIEDLKRRNISLRKGCWLEGYAVSLETECQAFLSSIASHDYLDEIQTNIGRINNAEFVFCGFVNEDGNAYLRGKTDKDNLYVYSDTSEEFLRFSKERHYTPFTPIFSLTTSK